MNLATMKYSAYAERVTVALKAVNPDVTEAEEREVRYCAVSLIRSVGYYLESLAWPVVVYYDALDAEMIVETPERKAFQYWRNRCQRLYSEMGI